MNTQATPEVDRVQVVLEHRAAPARRATAAARRRRRRARARPGSGSAGPHARCLRPWRRPSRCPRSPRSNYPTGPRSPRFAQALSPSETATDSIRISSSGRSWPSVSAFPIASTTSMPPETRPKTVCRPSSHGQASAVTMKNCEPFVFGPGVRHRDHAPLDRAAVRLVLELVAGAAHAGAGRVAALDHEVRDDAVEDDPVVEAVARKLDEVLDRLRRVVEELELDRALVRRDNCAAHGGDATDERPGGVAQRGGRPSLLVKGGLRGADELDDGVDHRIAGADVAADRRRPRLGDGRARRLRVPRRPFRRRPRRPRPRPLRRPLGLRRARGACRRRLPPAGDLLARRAPGVGGARPRDPRLRDRRHLLRLRLRRQSALGLGLRRASTSPSTRAATRRSRCSSARGSRASTGASGSTAASPPSPRPRSAPRSSSRSSSARRTAVPPR